MLWQTRGQTDSHSYCFCVAMVAQEQLISPIHHWEKISMMLWLKSVVIFHLRRWRKVPIKSEKDLFLLTFVQLSISQIDQFHVDFNSNLL